LEAALRHFSAVDAIVSFKFKASEKYYFFVFSFPFFSIGGLSPLSLSGCLYKIIYKLLLVERSKKVIGKVILDGILR